MNDLQLMVDIAKRRLDENVKLAMRIIELERENKELKAAVKELKLFNQLMQDKLNGLH